MAAGGSADAALTAMLASANGSGMIPEQVWDNAAPAGFTPGTPTKSMNPLNWAMGEFITLLVSASTGTIADQPSIVSNRYVAGAYQPHAGNTIDYNAAQVQPGKALTVYYHGSLDNQSHVALHWGYNNWNGVQDVQMVKRSGDGFWQATISVPSSATAINMALNNDAGTWDNNGGQNYNITIGSGGGSCVVGGVTATPCPVVHGQQVTITYNGSLAAGATSITMHWGYNSWNGVTDIPMTRQGNGTWTATITVPSTATSLNMAFLNQSNTWDNNNSGNYNFTVS